jgi:hypothetical protein
MVTGAVMAMVVAVAGRPEVMRGGEVLKHRSNIYTFICILRNLPRGKEPDEFRSVLNTVDTNEDGKISQSEFMTVCQKGELKNMQL